jgi:hypothetical protein
MMISFTTPKSEIVNGISIEYYPDEEYEFFMTERQVAKAYGLKSASIRNYRRNGDSMEKHGLKCPDHIQSHYFPKECRRSLPA